MEQVTGSKIAVLTFNYAQFFGVARELGMNPVDAADWVQLQFQKMIDYLSTIEKDDILLMDAKMLTIHDYELPVHVVDKVVAVYEREGE